jgi:predicted nuclease of restriction endonuclease-like (RecB) superfamily
MALAKRFTLPWSAYVRLVSVKTAGARASYETGALREGWSVRQLDRLISTLLYERLALSRNKAAPLRKAANVQPGDVLTPEEAIRGPFVLEFLDIKDEYSESDREEALIQHLADFLLELGPRFPFVARRYRLEVAGDEFFIDLLFYHLKLRCYVMVELKVTPFKRVCRVAEFYLSTADGQVKGPHEQPTIGLLLRKEDNRRLQGTRCAASSIRWESPNTSCCATFLRLSRPTCHRLNRSRRKSGRMTGLNQPNRNKMDYRITCENGLAAAPNDFMRRSLRR